MIRSKTKMPDKSHNTIYFNLLKTQPMHPAEDKTRSWSRGLKSRMFRIFLICACGTLPLSNRGQALKIQPDPDDALWKEISMRRSWVENLFPVTEIEPSVTAAERDLLQSILPEVRQTPASALNRLKNSIQPNSSAALDFMLGAIQYELGSFSEAEAAFKKAITKFSRFQRAYQLLGLTQLRQNRSSEAIPNLVQAVEMGGNDGALWGALGYGHILNQDWNAGRAAYERAISVNPENFEWRLGLAQCELGTSNYTNAIASLEKLSDLHPNRTEVWLYLANAYLGADRSIDAAMALEAAEKLGRRDLSTLLTLGDIYTNLEMIDPASQKYLAALTLNTAGALKSLPRAIDSWIRLEAWAAAELLIGKAKAASEWNALSVAERSQWIRLEALVAIHQGKDTTAENVLLQALGLNPLDGAIALELARFYVRQEKWIQAASYFSRAQKQKDVEKSALIEEGRMWTLSGDWERGLEKYKKAQERFPDPRLQKTILELERSIEARSDR